MAKPRKVEERAGAYAVPQKSVGIGNPSPRDQKPRYAGEAALRKAADKVFKVHDERLRKLAQ